MDSEVKILQAHFEELQKVVKEKDEIISKAELKEREISILAAERTRKELEAEFDLQIQRIEKELRIQNAAQIQANHQIVKKMQNEIEKHTKEKEDLSSKFSKLKEDFEETKTKLAEAEDQKRKMENTIQRSNQQTEKLLKETKRQLEDSEKSRQKEAAKLNAVINGLRKEHLGQYRHHHEYAHQPHVQFHLLDGGVGIHHAHACDDVDVERGLRQPRFGGVHNVEPIPAYGWTFMPAPEPIPCGWGAVAPEPIPCGWGAVAPEPMPADWVGPVAPPPIGAGGAAFAPCPIILI
uniref:Uncharacterized protein n=1 Tax=Acrobeloides nanus TaxID=290746 RepID=A0A914DGY5_9BILA